MNISQHLQLAKTVEMETVKLPARAERKLDGVRVMLYKGKFYTRRGKEMHLPIAEKNIKAVGMMVDFEVTLESGKVVDRPTVSGLLNSSQKASLNPLEEARLFFNVIDMMTTEEYETRYMTHNYSERLQDIALFVDMNRQANVREIPSWDVYNLSELQDVYNAQLDDGYEGVVVKQYKDFYTFKRSRNWARFKATKTADLLCIGVNAGKPGSKYEDMVGALVLEGTVEGKSVKVKAGSGLTDWDRRASKSTYLGKIIEVKYNTVIKDKAAVFHSLFLPRFSCIRHDK